jgi:tRNA pseudouridine32 synthase / 23S rRNA pseudouridine746 synthase
VTNSLEEAPRAALEVLYRDRHLVAFAKPPGLLTIPGRKAESDHVLGQGFRLLAETGASQKKLFVVHRLDRLTSGLVLFALDADSHRVLCRQFERREIDKRYLALVAPAPADTEGTLVSTIVTARRGFMRRARAGEEGLEAVTGYRVVDAARPEGALLALTPRTGRTHQIRLQLADLGSPIVGEPHYHPLDGEVARPSTRLWLHAWQIEFDHPATGRSVRIEAIPPKELAPASY